MHLSKPTGEATLQRITEGLGTPEETPGAQGRPRLRVPSRTFMLLGLCALLLVLATLCVLFLFPFVLLPETGNCGPPYVQLSIEELSLSPNRFALVRVWNCSGQTVWYEGYHQYPSYRVEYLAEGDPISWQLGNPAPWEEKIPLRPDETFLFVVPLGSDGSPKTQPEAVRVGMAVYRKPSASTDDFDWLWTAPKKLQ